MEQHHIRVLVFDNDLFFSVRIADSLKQAGHAAQTVRTLADFERGLRTEPAPALAFVNTAARGLDWTAAIETARETGIPVVAYGPHVEVETQQRAREAGAALVVANSKLAGDLPALVARALHRTDSGQAAATEAGET